MASTTKKAPPAKTVTIVVSRDVAEQMYIAIAKALGPGGGKKSGKGGKGGKGGKSTSKKAAPKAFAGKGGKGKKLGKSLGKKAGAGTRGRG